MTAFLYFLPNSVRSMFAVSIYSGIWWNENWGETQWAVWNGDQSNNFTEYVKINVGKFGLLCLVSISFSLLLPFIPCDISLGSSLHTHTICCVAVICWGKWTDECAALLHLYVPRRLLLMPWWCRWKRKPHMEVEEECWMDS